MLPFGSITSIIPLVVLGFAYLIYLGTSVMSRDQVVPATDTDLAKCITIEDTDKIVSNEGTCDWNTLFSDDQSIETSDQINPLTWLRRIIPLYDDQVSAEFCKVSYSIRPPPSI